MRWRKNKRLNYWRTITLIISAWSAKLLRKGSGNFEHFPSVACTWLSFVFLREEKFLLLFIWIPQSRNLPFS